MRPYSLILDLLAHDGGGVRQRIGMFNVLIADVGFISVLGRHNLRGGDLFIVLSNVLSANGRVVFLRSTRT